MKTLSVIANPFTSLDSTGAPNGFTFSDPLEAGARPFSVVAGKLITRVVRQADSVEDGREAKVEVGSHVSLKPHKVLNSPYHVERLRAGELFCADKVSADEIGMKFENPADLMKKSRDLRVEEWKAEHGGEAPPCARLTFAWDDKDGVKLDDPEAAPPAPVAPSPPAKALKAPKEETPAPALAPAPAKVIPVPVAAPEKP